jgi:hypothetical protein
MSMRRRLAVLLVAIVGFPAFSAGIPAAEEAPQASTLVAGIMKGKVVTGEKERAVAGAVVRAYHLDTDTLYTSAPADGKGRYEIRGLPLGYFDIAVETADGFFVGNQVVNVPPASKVDVSLSLSTFAGPPPAWLAGRAQQIPETDQPAIGIARLSRRTAERGFWGSPGGIAVISGGAALTLLAISSSGGNAPLASASLP